MDFLAGAFAAVVAVALALGIKRNMNSISDISNKVDDLSVVLSDMAGKDDE